MARTDLKERIRSGDILIGVSAPPNATKSQMEDILGKDDYAFINTDSQHSPYKVRVMLAPAIETLPAGAVPKTKAFRFLMSMVVPFRLTSP